MALIYKGREKEYQKEYREKHREKSKEYQKRWKIENRNKFKETQKESYLKKREYYIKKQREIENSKELDIKTKIKKRVYQKKYNADPNNQLKIKARIKTQYVVIQGLCEICKKIPATQKHHKDYNNPTDVQFLCGFCHNQLHGYGLINKEVFCGF